MYVYNYVNEVKQIYCHSNFFFAYLDLDSEVNIYLCVSKGCMKYVAIQISPLMTFLCTLHNCLLWDFVLTLYFPKAIKNKSLFIYEVFLHAIARYPIVLFLKRDLIL